MPPVTSTPNMSQQAIYDLSLTLRNKGNELAEDGNYTEAIKVDWHGAYSEDIHYNFAIRDVFHV